jgi:hypothetical protein
MKMRLFLFFFAALVVAGRGFAQNNTTPALAANVQWGQKAFTLENGTNSQAWWDVTVVAGRSYCVETGNLETGPVFGDRSADTVLNVFREDTTTVLVHNDDIDFTEPRAPALSRACWIPSVTEDNFVQLTPFNGTTASYVEVRFVETTLFCPWFFIAGDYNAFSLIKNTSFTNLNGVVVSWWGLNGTLAASTTVNIPANGTIVVNARDFVNPATFSNGSISIAHTGSPQQLVGSTTTLSGTTGLGFDAVFTQRQPW